MSKVGQSVRVGYPDPGNPVNSGKVPYVVGCALLLIFLATSFLGSGGVKAQAPEPSMLHPNLAVRQFVGGLITPISIAFIGDNDILALEKNTGQVKRILNGSVHSTVLDLAVNAASERGLLGIALHPDFPTNPGVYLFWTCHGTPPPPDNPFFPVEAECPDTPQLGADTEDVLAVPLLGNRVDRFVWNGSTLTFDRNLIKLLAFQNDGAPVPPGQGDETQPPRGNHDGGVLAFGPDRKLYIMFGDAGRRGQLQNLPSGPTATGLGPVMPDDQFGGPQPDDAHFTGVILRLNDDGSTPTDNPLFSAGAAIGGEVGENIKKVFAYGVRNSFGMAFDPLSGNLWDQENGEDAFDELNLVEPGMNSGWIQVIGPARRVAEYKLIETTALHHEDFPNLQQLRWPPERIADTQQAALSRLFVLPGSHYSDPEFSWKHVLAPAAIGFLNSRALGPQFFGDLFVGFSVPEPLGGPLFHFNLTGNRKRIGVDDPRLEDRVADNRTFHDMAESESLLIGRDFGVVTDIKTGPNGNLFVVTLDKGAIYEITRSR
ncbi:MAG TPA: PQQ-dependent sugar dehydrogenase [Blastocatellia bacterium]|nr:PQQ-dependent sugar dehydrogenase [Blastocatellia bacterium]